jgi:hypothetical protein
MIAVQNEGSGFGDVFFADNCHIAKEQSHGVDGEEL